MSNHRGAHLLASLPALQNHIKRDALSYKDEFVIQWNHYRALLELIKSNNIDKHESEFREAVSFIAQVAACYPQITAAFPHEISHLLLESHQNLSPDTRRTLVSSLVLLRNRGVTSSSDLLKSLMPLLSITTSKTTRDYIQKTILSDIKSENKKCKNHKLNRMVQGLLFDMIERGVEPEDSIAATSISGTGTKRHGKQAESSAEIGKEALWAVTLASTLYNKGVWTDDRTANLLALACFHVHTKVQSAALHFFLASGIVTEEESGSEDEKAEGIDIRKVKHQALINKKTKAGVRNSKRLIKAAAKRQRAQESAKANPINASGSSAIHLLRDPQTIAERLYGLLVKHDKRYTLQHKLLIMQLTSRLMGTHKLCVLPFYSYVTKYLHHHQLNVTSILVAVASSVHNLTPPDVLTPVINKLAHEFVHPGVAPEVIAAGLNAIREIARRQIWCIEREMLEDLVAYRKSRDKGVMMAARSLLALYREVNPGMLKRRERGKAASTRDAKDNEPLQYGYTADNTNGIEGLDLLAQHLANKPEGDEENEEDEWGAWQVDSEDESDDEGWIKVSSDEEQDIAISGSDSDSDSDSESDADSDSDSGEGESDGEEAQPEEGSAAQQAQAMVNLAATKILTPADFAKLHELRTKAAEEAVASAPTAHAKRKLAALKASAPTTMAGDNEEFLTENTIVGVRKKAKMDYEARLASIAAGREGREKFGSAKGKRKTTTGASTTNKEKRKTKNFDMVKQSREVRGKGKASLRAKQRRLQGHSKSLKKNVKKARG